MIRRTFCHKLSVTALTYSLLPYLKLIDSGMTILFQGDSITDAGRDRGRYYPNDASGLGNGYVGHIATELLGKYPDKDLKIYNRGISGNKVYQLSDRWEDDCLQLQPDILSILIGVNDFWHMLNGHYAGTIDKYENDLRALLDRTLQSNQGVKLIIAEPFVVHGGTAVGSEKWSSEFPAYQYVARVIASDYNARFIPLQTIFDEALDQYPAAYWCPDGVHPSMAGSYLMAQAWLQSLESLISE